MIGKPQPVGPATAPATGWFLLAHQLPAGAAYLRVKIWRQLREAGAVALKNSLYVLPRTDETRDAFLHLLRQIEQGGGEGALCEAKFVAGLRDGQIETLFNTARDADYQALAKSLRAQASRRTKNRETELKLKLQKGRQQLAQIVKIDFFDAGGRQAVEAVLSQLEHSLIARTDGKAFTHAAMPSLRGRTWVTRRDMHVDRIASAWLIRRFIDPKAKFKFVATKSYRHAQGELRFDMADGEFTHEGDKCSFEVLLERSGVSDRALTAIAEIVHDLDLQDRKFDRPETSGIGHIIEGICASQSEDAARIARGSVMLDDIHARFSRKTRPITKA
jgi:hypothetical protein